MRRAHPAGWASERAPARNPAALREMDVPPVCFQELLQPASSIQVDRTYACHEYGSVRGDIDVTKEQDRLVSLDFSFWRRSLLVVRTREIAACSHPPPYFRRVRVPLPSAGRL